MSNDSDNKNLPQIVPNKNIVLASKQLATVNKALITINHQKFIEFLVQNEYATKFFFIRTISRCSNVLDMDLIEQHADQFCWGSLSSNNSLPWSEALIERYADKWAWVGTSGMMIDGTRLGGLSENNLPWSEALIERYQDKWDWKELSSNESLPWSEELLERYADKWDWLYLACNENAVKLFNSWTRQEISTALERIRSA